VLNDDQLTLHFSDVDGLLGRMTLVLFPGVPAALALWLLFLSVNQLRIMAGVAPAEFDNLQLVIDPSTPWQVIGAGIACLVVVFSFGFLAVRFAVLGWRCTRRRWWLRLSTVGFEVNDRIFRPRRYQWSDIDGFVLVGPRVEFRYLSGKRRSWRSGGHGYVMGWWDRPFDQAVELMNVWLTRYRAA